MRIRSIRTVTDCDDSHHQVPPDHAGGVRPKTALTEAEAAQYIGMSAAWLKKSRTKRFREVIDAPPFVRAGAKRIVYRVNDLDRWQERHLERVGPMEAPLSSECQ